MSRIAREYPDDPEMWANPVVPIPAFPPPCKCSHPESLHYRDRKDRPTCGIAVCGCTAFRPKESA